MKKHNKGFTLVELIIILALLASATAVAAPNIFSAESKAETEACRDQMDMILNGFQAQQFSSTSPYAYRTLADGRAKLTTFIENATDSVLYSSVGMGDPAACPSGPTDYQAVVNPDDGRLYVYCPTHDVYSHNGLSGHEREPDEMPYTNLESWTGSDNNWVVGDHESFFVLPLEEQYYHMEIGFQLFAYDDGEDNDGDPTYEYRYNDPDWYLQIPTESTVEAGSMAYYESVKPKYGTDKTRPLGYELGNYNATDEGVSFALAVDFQEIDGGYDFSSSALELKNIKSNAAESLTVDIAKDSAFEPDSTLDRTHNRKFFDGITDWMIIDIVENDGEKLMFVHMMDANGVFQSLYPSGVSIPIKEDGVKFAFFMGKRIENYVDKDDPNVKNGLYYADAFPSPIQVKIESFNIDYDGLDKSGKPYSEWYEQGVNYKDYTDYKVE